MRARLDQWVRLPLGVGYEPHQYVITGGGGPGGGSAKEIAGIGVLTTPDAGMRGRSGSFLFRGKRANCRSPVLPRGAKKDSSVRLVCLYACTQGQG